MTDHDCIFCRIVADEATAYRLDEDDRTLAFLDAFPAAEGHALVVPKTHHENLLGMDASLAGDVFETVHRVASAIDAAFDSDGITIHQSNGAAAGQDVFHAHVHVVPRFDGDSLSTNWPAGTLGDDGRAVAKVIRDRL